MITGRSRWKIILDILKVVQRSSNGRKTYIMKNANLDSKNFVKYSDFLMETGFMALCDQDNSYLLTEKGRELLRRLNEVEGLLVKI